MALGPQNIKSLASKHAGELEALIDHKLEVALLDDGYVPLQN